MAHNYLKWKMSIKLIYRHFFMSWTHSFYGIMLFQMDINLSLGTELSAIKPYVSAI